MKKEDILSFLVSAKKYKISEDVLMKIIKRDIVCVYCHKRMKRHPFVIGTPKDKATIEHFSDVGEYYAKEDEVGICCGECNRRRGNKKLFDWFKMEYCIKGDINQKTVAKPIKDYIRKNGKKS